MSKVFDIIKLRLRDLDRSIRGSRLSVREVEEVKREINRIVNTTLAIAEDHTNEK